MRFGNVLRRLYRARICLAFVALFAPSLASAQGPAPETAPPLFPGGGLLSYNSVFTSRGMSPDTSTSIPTTARPSFSHEGDINFTWGFFRNFDVTVLLPVVTNHFEVAGSPAVAGTGLGDTMLLVKYRFYRRDSERGTTQASLTIGPKVPTPRLPRPGFLIAREAFHKFLRSRH
jgi:hypothetical protein